MINHKLFLRLSVLSIVAFPCAAIAQPIVAIDTGNGGITAVATFTNGANGSISTIAVQSTFPAPLYAETATATLGTPVDVAGNIILTSLEVSGTVTVPTTSPTVESVVADEILNATTLNDQISLIRAWRSGGID